MTRIHPVATGCIKHQRISVTPYIVFMKIQKNMSHALCIQYQFSIYNIYILLHNMTLQRYNMNYPLLHDKKSPSCFRIPDATTSMSMDKTAQHACLGFKGNKKMIPGPSSARIFIHIKSLQTTYMGSGGLVCAKTAKVTMSSWPFQRSTQNWHTLHNR